MREGQKISFAKELRAASSDAERLLWSKLRARQILNAKFRRQYPIGAYVVDFACVEHTLVIELDGGQHAEQLDYDEARSAYLHLQEFEVFRFWNHDVLTRTDDVLQQIWTALQRPHPSPLPQAGEGTKSQINL
jgi:very-short-patch-repair endonuclease